MREAIEVGDIVKTNDGEHRGLVVGIDLLVQWQGTPPPGHEPTPEGITEIPIEEAHRMIPLAEVTAEMSEQSQALAGKLTELQAKLDAVHTLQGDEIERLLLAGRDAAQTILAALPALGAGPVATELARVALKLAAALAEVV